MTLHHEVCEIDCEFHCHTLASHDAFTSLQDLIGECHRKHIQVVTITEHDVLNLTERDQQICADAGIQLIPGCEMTTDTGAHIIGLFIETAVVNKSATEVVDHVLSQDGLVYIPHPFKKQSGLFWALPPEHSENQYVLSRAHFIELYNGGWSAKAYERKIRELAQKYSLRLVAGSDSHRPWEVGHFKNRLTLSKLPLNAKALLSAPIEMLGLTTNRSDNETKRSGKRKRLLKRTQQTMLYQKVVRRVPYSFKRKIKEINYRRQRKKHQRQRSHFSYTALS